MRKLTPAQFLKAIGFKSASYRHYCWGCGHYYSTHLKPAPASCQACLAKASPDK